MTFRQQLSPKHLARATALLLMTVSIAGCDSLPSIPYINEKSAEVPAQEAVPQPVKAKPLSRNEKIAKGLSEELDWFPSLEQPLEQLQQSYAATPNDSGRDRTLSSIAYLYDAQLFVLFQDMLDFLPKNARIIELQEQNDWLNRRKGLVTQAFLKEQDEVAARINASQAFIEVTRKRIDEIEAKRKLVVFE